MTRHLTATRDTTLCGQDMAGRSPGHRVPSRWQDDPLPETEWPTCERCRDASLWLGPAQRSILAVVALD